MEELLDSQVQQQNSCDTDLIKIADGILFDARANLRDKSVIRMPISQLSTLGAGVASLVPAFRTVTQTSVTNVDGFYKLVNAGAGDALKAAKKREFLGRTQNSGRHFKNGAVSESRCGSCEHYNNDGNQSGNRDDGSRVVLD